MGQDDVVQLHQEILQAIKENTDSQTLESRLELLVDDFAKKYPEEGRANALHEATSVMFNNDARHHPFFGNLAISAYDSLVTIEKWYDSSTIAEHMIGYQIELVMNQEGDEDDIRMWFMRWADSVKKWAIISESPESWQNWGTGILNRCESFSYAVPGLQYDVYEFWNSMIDTCGTFAPIPEVLERHESELVQNAVNVRHNLDSAQLMKRDFTNRVRLLERLDVGDLVDRMNMLIESAPKEVTDDEIEVEMNLINSAKDIREACRLTNDLATRLRIQGNMKKAIEILSSVVETENDPAEIEELALSALKLAIYLDEIGPNPFTEPLLKRVADAEHGPGSLHIVTVDQACQRYSAFLVEAGRLAESKEYGIRHNALAEMMGDPFLFVRSCFNVVTDCHELGQEEEAEEWFVLGMANLKDGIGVGPMGQIPPNLQQELIVHSHSVSVLIGREEEWEAMREYLFRDDA